uniref:Uncharacterized protein n=1 Tax=Anguilla anguilla TaxID=7936 RepID=A0A0E9QQI3_ANGAN
MCLTNKYASTFKLDWIQIHKVSLKQVPLLLPISSNEL